MNNILTRAISGFIYVALIIASILLGTYWFIGLIALFTILGVIELQRLLSNKARIGIVIRACDIIAAIMPVLLILGLELKNENTVFAAIALLILYISARIILAVADRSENPAKSFLYSLMSIAYVAWPLALLCFAYWAAGLQLVIATFVFIWLNDTGAYLSGCTFGRTKLCERLSPKKTWEGFWGGFTLTLIAGVACGWLIGDSTIKACILWGIYASLVSIIGTYGDLFESLIKRSLNVKDSGELIPGHGGILDRIDSLLAVAPLTAIIAFLL